MNALRCGRLTALRKPDGGVRGIVVGDVFRRVVARRSLHESVATDNLNQEMVPWNLDWRGSND